MDDQRFIMLSTLQTIYFNEVQKKSKQYQSCIILKKNTFTNLLRLAKIKFYDNKFRKVLYNPKLTEKWANEIISGNLKNNDSIETIIM